MASPVPVTVSVCATAVGKPAQAFIRINQAHETAAVFEAMGYSGNFDSGSGLGENPIVNLGSPEYVGAYLPCHPEIFSPKQTLLYQQCAPPKVHMILVRLGQSAILVTTSLSQSAAATLASAHLRHGL